MSLQNVQAEFLESLLDRDYQTDLVTPTSHLAIYRNNINASLVNTLKNTYPLILALLGEDFFMMAAKEYIRQYPSRSGNLHDYGQYLSFFLECYQPVHDLMYLTEVAEFEWACHITYLAADHPPFAQQSLSAFTPEQYEQLHFILNPASSLKRFHYPILDMVDLCKTNQQNTIDLHSGGVNLLMIRRELDLSLIALAKADFVFLEALQNNRTLIDALHAAQHVDANYQLDVKLPAFIQDKILVDCYLSDE